MTHTPRMGRVEQGLAKLRKVKAGFILQDTTLGKWCRDQGIDRAHASRCIQGIRNGPMARALRQRIAEAAGVSIE